MSYLRYLPLVAALSLVTGGTMLRAQESQPVVLPTRDVDISYQITRPNHRRRPNQPPPTNPRKPIPKHLIRHRKKQLKSPSKILPIKHPLTNQYISGINRTPPISSISHYYNDCMFFKIESPGAEVKFYIKELEFFVGEDNIPE